MCILRQHKSTLTKCMLSGSKGKFCAGNESENEAEFWHSEREYPARGGFASTGYYCMRVFGTCTLHKSFSEISRNTDSFYENFK